MSATGAAHAAITVINATATGRGASLAVQGGVQATWAWQGSEVQLQADVDDRLAHAVHACMARELGRSDGASVTTQAAFPPSRGLKTSSGAAAAMIQAAARDAGRELEPDTVVDLAIEASRAAGVTLTGARDDQAAVVHGGCQLTDNHAGTTLERIPVEPWPVAIWIPDHSLPKSSIAAIDATPLRDLIDAAEQLLRMGDLPGALTANGAAYHRLYHAAGLPVTDAPVDAAVDAGAIAAGLSGTGPAAAALFPVGDDPEPRDVPGGRWVRTEVVP